MATEHLIVRRKSTGTNLYKITSDRDLTTYPRTPQGDLAYLAAATNGSLSLTAENGCGITVGTKPPVTVPVCSGGAAGPAWAGAKYSYLTFGNNTVLTIEASVTLSSSDNVKMRFERADGAVINTTNPDGVLINNTTWYYGSDPTPTTRRWQIIYNTAPSMKITIRRESDQAVFAHTFTPVAGTSNGQLFTAAQAAGCNFNVSVNTVNVSCGASVTLTATVSGSDASGVTVAWSNGMTGNSITFNAPGFNGTYLYTATASKSGCGSKTASGSVTVSGCPDVQPPTGSFPYTVPTQQAPWDGYSTEEIGFQNLPILDYDQYENDKLIFQIRRGLGCLYQVKHKGLNKWCINSPDLGRGDGPSSYTQQHSPQRVGWTDRKDWIDENGNHPFTADGAAPAPGPWFTAYNPLKDGDFAGHPATLLFHGKITIGGIEYTYTKTQLNSWSHNDNRMLPMYLEQWGALVGNKIVSKSRLTHNRTDDLTDYGPALQEWCLMMVNGMGQAVYYNGHRPYTNDGVTYSEGYERQVGDIFIKKDREFPISEPWIGVTLKPGSDQIIAQYDPTLYFPSYNSIDFHEGGDYDGSRTGVYTCGHQMANLDAKGVWYFDVTWVVGTVAEVREFVYTQPRVSKPDWHFNAQTQRNGWHGNNGVTDDQLPIAATNAGWGTRWVGKADGGPANIDNTYISSPRTAFYAGDCPTCYVKVKLSNTTQTNWKFKWTYMGQERESIDTGFPYQNSKRFPYNPNQGRPESQAVSFQMNPDGNEYVYAIPMSWDATKYISNIEIWADGSTLRIQPNMLVSFIGFNNPN